VGQFAWGAIQPLAGALADRHGPRGVLWVGVLTLALGCALTPWVSSGFGLTVTLGLLAAMGSGVGSFSVLIGAAAQQLPAQARGAASGVINAGGSFGQFIFAPILQGLIQRLGWMGAMWGMAAMTLLALPMVGRLTRGYQPPPAPSAAEGGVLRAIRTAMADRSYLLLHLGFFTCGFHIAFLVTHLPGEVNLCGLPPSVASWSLAIIGLSNIVGSLYAGACVSRYRSKYVLAVMYGSRALLIALYLMAPATAWTYYLFAAGLGLTWLATVPPTAAIIGKQVVGPGGGRGHQVKRNQQRARAIHHRQHIFAAVARHARPGVQAADNIRQADNGQRPAGHRRRQAAQIHLAGQVGDQKGNMKAAGEKPQVQQQIAAVGHRRADGAQHTALRRAGRGRRLVAARQPAHHRQRQ
jgi:predicted MFS family arabinose efflux permease